MAAWDRHLDETKDQGGTKSVGEFLQEHYEKFAIMGIFVTVSVFFRTTWPGSEDGITRLIATVASLGVFGIVALWIMIASAKEIRQSRHDWPGLTEAGYAFIMVATGSLGGSVLVGISGFQKPVQLLIEAVLVTLIVLLYVNLNPEFLSDDSEELNWAQISSGASFGGAWILTLDIFARQLAYWIEQIPLIAEVYFIQYFVGFFMFQFIIQHGLLGLGQFRKTNVNLRKCLLGPWSLWTSFFIIFISLSIIFFSMEQTAQAVSGGRTGYYAVFGFYWKRTMLLYCIGAFGGSTTLYLLYDIHQEKRKYVKWGAQIFSLSYLIFALANVAFFIPGGTHTIPL